jgi:DNA-binding MarR family transcriptional regulator
MTGMDKSTLKELLGRMAARGLVERLRDPADSRAWRLHPTSHGRRVLTEVLPHIESAQRDILAPLPPSHRALFLRMLRILAGLETLGEGARALPDVKSI